MDTSPPKRPELLFPDGEQALVVSPDLAYELKSLPKALVLRQVNWWLKRSRIYRDGHYWHRCSLRWMQRFAFKWTSVSAISRWITSLVEDGYLIEGYNIRNTSEQTRWLALNPEGLARLKSVCVDWKDLSQNETEVFQNGTGVSQNGTEVFQNGTNQESLKNLSKEGNQESSDTTPHPDDDEDSDTGDKKHSVQGHLDPAGKFGTPPVSMIADLQAQIARLGDNLSRAVAERCQKSGGRSWAYLLTALSNEKAPPSAQRDYRTGPYAKYINVGDDDEETPEQEAACRQAYEEERQRKVNAPIQVTERVATPWGEQTVQDAWDQTCQRLQTVLDRATYGTLIGNATLADFYPTTQTFIVVLGSLAAYSKRYEIHYNTIYRMLLTVYGNPKADVRFLTRADWLYRSEPSLRNQQGENHAVQT